MKQFVVPEKTIYVCVGRTCGPRGGCDTYRTLRRLIRQSGLKETVEVVRTECTDRCDFAPVLSVQPANVWLKQYDESDAPRILRTAIRNE